MAEAVVEQRPLTRFFCYQCSEDISPNLPDYTCPRCENGFIEEITSPAEETPTPEHNPADPAAQFAELFGRSFLQNFQQHLNSQPGLEDSDSDPEDVDMDNINNRRQLAIPRRLNSFPQFGMTAVPATRISIRTRNAGGQVGGAPPTGQGDHGNQAIQSMLQSLLTGLLGGPPPGQGGAAMGFPFGNMFSMYGSPGDYAWGTTGLDNIITQLLNQMEGAGPPPAEQADIDRLKDITISKDETDRGVQCSVCMDDFKEGDKTKGLPCEHLFHPDCILPWLQLHGTCPVCRMSVSDGDTSSPTSPSHRHSPDSTTQSSPHPPHSRAPVTDDDDFD